MSLSPELESILANSKTHQKFAEFLRKNNFTMVKDVGLLASTETVFEDKTLPLLKAANIPTESLSDIVALKKAWHACRGAVEREASTAAGRIPPVVDSSPLSAPDKTTITKA